MSGPGSSFHLQAATSHGIFGPWSRSITARTQVVDDPQLLLDHIRRFSGYQTLPLKREACNRRRPLGAPLENAIRGHIDYVAGAASERQGSPK